jgi:hypothetical protein
VLRRIAKQAVTGRVPLPRRQGDRAWALPGVGRGDLRGAVGIVPEAATADLDGTEDGLEGVRGRATAGELSTVLAVPLGHDELGVGALDGLREQAAFEQLAPPFDPRFEASGAIGILLGQGPFQAELGPKDQAIILDLDLGGGGRSLKLLRGTPEDALRRRGGVAMRALLSNPYQIFPIRPQTGDRQGTFSS